MQLASEVSRDIDSHLTQGQGDHEEQLFGKVEVDVHIDASADKFHELMTSKPHHIPNISPANVQHVATDANWGKLGSVITWHYVHEGKNCVAKREDPCRRCEQELDHFQSCGGRYPEGFQEHGHNAAGNSKG
ncbi:MLP-like protein 28 [Neltuma alba]|uniref:MLP-like protein 28 n=1 Tax=Neltuma alba TaxID=207710 RepID=UPI0010A3296D|nr:MLP-like protein 28 [Prosopis alba]